MGWETRREGADEAEPGDSGSSGSQADWPLPVDDEPVPVPVSSGAGYDIGPSMRRLGYPDEIRTAAERLRHPFAQGELLASVDELIEDVRHPTALELKLFLAVLDDAAEAGAGDLERGLLLAWEQRTGQRPTEASRPEPVEAAFAQLTDDRATARLQEKIDRIFRNPAEPTKRDLAELEKMLTGLRRTGDLQSGLIVEWKRARPEPRPWGDHADALPACRQELTELAEALRKGHPAVTGTDRLADRLEAELNPLRRMELGEREATAQRLAGLRGNVDGVRAEWQSARERAVNGPVVVAAEFTFTDPAADTQGAVDVDVVDDAGKLWVEVKNRRPFTTASPAWEKLKGQVQRLLLAAEQNPLDGQPRTVVVEFRQGVTRSVAEGLAQMDVQAVRGRRIGGVGEERTWER